MQSMTIRSDLNEVSGLAEWLRQLLAEKVLMEVSAKNGVISQLELLLVEFVNNVIEHGYAGDAHQHIDVSVAVVADRIVLRVVDRGNPPPSVDAYQSADVPEPECLPESGWGIGLINAIADEIEVERTGAVNTSILTKYVEPVAGICSRNTHRGLKAG